MSSSPSWKNNSPEAVMTRLSHSIRPSEMSREEFVDEAYATLDEKFPAMSHDRKADLVQSAIQQRAEFFGM